MTKKTKNDEKPKRKMSEKQLANLIPFSKNNERLREKAKKCQKIGVEKRKENQAEKITRQQSPDIIFDEFFGTREQLRELWEELPPKEKKDLLIRLLPPDTQKQEVTGGLITKTVFVSEEQRNETLKHIYDVVNKQ